MACPRFKASAKGLRNSFVATTNGVRYHLRRDLLSGRWEVRATIGGVTRPIGGPGSMPGGFFRSRGAAKAAVCNHSKFYLKNFRRR